MRRKKRPNCSTIYRIHVLRYLSVHFKCVAADVSRMCVLAYLITRWILSARTGRCKGNDSDSGLLNSSFNCSWVFIVRAYTRRDIVLTRLPVCRTGRTPSTTNTSTQRKFSGNGLSASLNFLVFPSPSFVLTLYLFFIFDISQDAHVVRVCRAFLFSIV